MPAVFVHGNPETAAIWDELFQSLARTDVIALSPPGFGSQVPLGFDASANAYLQWLEAEVERVGREGPIDLVGHDWGGLHVARLAMSRPDLIRSWVSDAVGALEPEYDWHDNAQQWIAPEIGEKSIAAIVGLSVEDRTNLLSGLGLGKAAGKVAPAIDAQMGECILRLYRSAAQPALKQWGQDWAKAAARPGLVIAASEDPYTGGEKLTLRAADRAAARVVKLEGRGHWWMCEAPQEGARALTEFWALQEKP